MSSHRRKPLILTLVALVGLWLVTGLGYYVAHQHKITAERVMAFMSDTDPSVLSADARKKALAELARQINLLPADERRQVRLGGDWDRWFKSLTEEEKGEFIESTMPSGFKQMLSSFEQLPVEKRRKTVDDALRDLRRTRDAMAENQSADGTTRISTNSAPMLSEELQQKVVQIGLKSFYSDSSAQTKAELAPVIEEMQRAMESGQLFRRDRR